MRNGFRQSMAWLHTWSGLVVGWVLFSVFVTGTASYYRPEISRWMRPELHARAEFGPEAMAAAAERGVAYLEAHARAMWLWSIRPPSFEKPVIEVSWRPGPGAPPNRVMLDPQTGQRAAVRETWGGDFLYRFHFDLHMPATWGSWIVGVCAMSMLVAILSGIVTHRRIFTDFFTFRRDKSAQRGWLDAHNVSGVLALPYYLMITYTGLVTFAFLYMPWGQQLAYPGDPQRHSIEAGLRVAPRAPANRPGTLAPVGPMLRQALAMASEPLETINVLNPHDARATVVVVFEEPPGISHEHPQVAFDGATGKLIETRQGGLKPVTKTLAVMVGLHEGGFAGPALRILFFLSGMMGCAMCATGLVLWSVVRLPKHDGERSFGARLVNTLNIGTVAGLPAAIAGFFLANRLLPVDIADHAAWEIRAFFATWLLVAITAAFRKWCRGWAEMLSAAATLYLLVAAVDGVRLLGDIGLGKPIDPLFPAVDIAMLVVALGLFAAARKIVTYEGGSRMSVGGIAQPQV